MSSNNRFFLFLEVNVFFRNCLMSWKSFILFYLGKRRIFLFPWSRSCIIKLVLAVVYIGGRFTEFHEDQEFLSVVTAGKFVLFFCWFHVIFFFTVFLQRKVWRGCDLIFRLKVWLILNWNTSSAFYWLDEFVDNLVIILLKF